MLKNALLYKDQIDKKLLECWYDPKYQYYFSSSHYLPRWNDNDADWIALASVKGDDVLGYFTWAVDHDTMSAKNFGVINFSDDQLTFGVDLYHVLKQIFFICGYKRLEFGAIQGNPHITQYTHLVDKFGGECVGHTHESIRTFDGRIHDEFVFEIMADDFVSYYFGGYNERRQKFG